MKRILFLLLLMCPVSTWAQDVIVKRDGTVVVCRVINVSSLEIVYKKWTDLQGSNLVMSVADAASITYENGEKKTFDVPATNVPTPMVQNPMGQQTVSDDALLKIYQRLHYHHSGQQTVSDDALLKMVMKPELTLQEKMQKKAKKLKIGGCAAGVCFTSVGASLVLLGVNEGSADWVWIAPGIISMVVIGPAITTACLIRAHNIKKNNSLYSVQSTPLLQQEFHLKNSTTLTPSIDMLKDNTRHNPTLGIGLSYNF